MAALLLVWQAPLGVHIAKCGHPSPEWTILSHSYRLIQWEIVRPQVLLDSLHPCSTRTSWWSPPVLRRGSSYDTPVICLLWHSCNVAERRKLYCFSGILWVCKVLQTSTVSDNDSIYAIARICYRPFVCLSVRPSDGCIIQKRLKMGLWNFHHTIAPSL